MVQHGTDLTIVSGLENKTVRGFFRAVNSKSWQSMESEASLLGEITRGQYVYMGPVDGAVKEGDTLILGDRSYLFRRTELYYYGNQAVYQWGLCVEKGVNDTWGIQSYNWCCGVCGKMVLQRILPFPVRNSPRLMTPLRRCTLKR